MYEYMYVHVHMETVKSGVKESVSPKKIKCTKKNGYTHICMSICMCVHM